MLTTKAFFHSAIQTVKALQADLGLTSFLTPEVNHRGKAYGLVMQHESGWKIS
jgi:ribonuclease Z